MPLSYSDVMGRTSSGTVQGNTSSYKTLLNEASDSLEDKMIDGSF